MYVSVVSAEGVAFSEFMWQYQNCESEFFILIFVDSDKHEFGTIAW